MKLDFILVADMANVDAAGKFNIIGEFNMLMPSELPSPPLRLALVLRLIAAASEGPEHRVHIVIVDQDGQELVRTPDMSLPFVLFHPGTSGDLRAQAIVGINGARFPKYGSYAFHVLVDGRHIGDRSIYVVAPPQPLLPASST